MAGSHRIIEAEGEEKNVHISESNISLIQIAPDTIDTMQAEYQKTIDTAQGQLNKYAETVQNRDADISHLQEQLKVKDFPLLYVFLHRVSLDRLPPKQTRRLQHLSQQYPKEPKSTLGLTVRL